MLTTHEYLITTLNDFRSFYRGTPSFHLLEETFMTLFSGFEFKLYCPYFEDFNKKVGEMNSNGMFQDWFANLFNVKGLKRNRMKSGPQVLTLDDLSVGFQICLIPMSLSVVSFLAELSTPWLKIFVSNIKEKLFSLSLIKSYLDVIMRRNIM